MTGPGPLAGLRVLDLTGDLGRFGAKLLAEWGADVARPIGTDSPGRPLPPVAGRSSGVLDAWFDGFKSPIELDLDSEGGRADYRALAAVADLIIESQPVDHLAERGIDHPDLVADNPALTQVSLTPFGRTGPRRHWLTSDLVAGALGGVVSITGTEDEPLNSWGWQNYNFGGFVAAICGLAGVRAASRRGQGQLVDVALHEVVVSSIENLLMQYLYDDLLDLPKLARRQGSLHWLGAYEVVPAASGHVMVTPTPQTERLVEWMVESGIERARPFLGLAVEDVLAHMPEIMACIREFALTTEAGPLWREAQERHIAFGEVQDVAQVAANPQLAHRDFFTEGAAGRRGPWRLVRFSDTPIGTGPAPVERSGAPDLAATWSTIAADRVDASEPTGERSDPPLQGLVVLDLSWVLAGPFATRILGDLGADVIKLQTEERATLVNQPEFPYYPVWNRSKRSVTLDLKHPDALAAIRPLVERADVLVENYSAGVLDRLGLGWEAVHGWNDRLVYVSMSGCGHHGPWADVISYAPTIHALCGLTHLTNPEGRGDVGCGFSLNDHAAGFGAALAVLAALEARARTGVGQHIDMAQLEVGATLVGPALVEHFATGANPTPAGNADGLVDAVPNEIYRCADGTYLAITANDDAMWGRLVRAMAADDGALDGPGLETVASRRERRDEIDRALGRWCADQQAVEAMERLQGAGVAAGVVQDAADLVDGDPQLAARDFWLEAESPSFGPRRHDRFPARWSTSRLDPYRPAPSYLGEANFDVWTTLAGLDPEEVAEGIADGLFR